MINKVTVIGSGLMGAGIAAHLSNAGIEVLLLDVLDKNSKNRNNIADEALKKLTKIKPSPLTLSKNIKLISFTMHVNHNFEII